jgi:hypothetical protein
MKEAKLDLFNPPQDVDAICITTNGMIRSDGKAVMGRGVALSAKNKFFDIDKILARQIRINGNVTNIIHCYINDSEKLVYVFSLPTKNDWKDNSDINLIIQSCKRLVEFVDQLMLKNILLPRPGCTNGGLSWEQVKKAIEPILDDRFTIVWR